MTEVKVNLWGQKKSRYYRLYLTLTGASLIYILTSHIIPTIDFRPYLVLWILFLPGFLATAFYFSAKLPTVRRLLPFLKLSRHYIEIKRSIFEKPSIVYWKDLQDIIPHLFDIHLKTKDHQTIHIDLTVLTDENRARVKQFIRERVTEIPVAS